MLTHAASQYQQTHVMTSSNIQLVVLLYDAAVKSIELAREGMVRNNVKDKARFLGRAVAIVTELSNVLDFNRGGDIARSLHRLYDYMLAEFVQANVHNHPGHLEGPLRCLSALREAWQQIARQGVPHHVPAE
jgi:flagellar protein FliS